MKEIEVKARVERPEDLLGELEKRGISLSQPISQRDIVYINGDWEFTKFNNERNIVRLRREDRRALLTLKRPGVNELDSLEEETEVSNPESVERMLGLLDYHEIVRVNKVRRKAKYGGMELCLDTVEEIGTFMEVEQLVDEGDTEAIQEELFQFLESLGISRSQRITQGYDTLVRLKREEKG